MNHPALTGLGAGVRNRWLIGVDVVYLHIPDAEPDVAVPHIGVLTHQIRDEQRLGVDVMVLPRQSTVGEAVSAAVEPELTRGVPLRLPQQVPGETSMNSRVSVSRTTQSTPACLRMFATVSPAGPAPTTTAETRCGTGVLGC
jgi:hypothetical protein